MHLPFLGSIAIFVSTFAMGPTSVAEDVLPTIGTGVGDLYPDFLLPSLDGKMGRLSDYRGKKVLLINFASW